MIAAGLILDDDSFIAAAQSRPETPPGNMAPSKTVFTLVNVAERLVQKCTLIMVEYSCLTSFFMPKNIEQIVDRLELERHPEYLLRST
jgi:hypothetical protein